MAAVLISRPPPSLSPIDKVSGNRVLRSSSKYFPSVAAAMPISTHHQTWGGVRGQCSRAQIQSHLEHEDIGAASSQINSILTGKYFRKAAEKEEKGKEKSEKRATDSDIMGEHCMSEFS